MTHRRAMLQARLESQMEVFPNRFNKDSLEWGRYKAMYLNGKITMTELIELTQEDLQQYMIKVK